MRIYLAARYSRHPEMQAHAAYLRALGHEVTSRWIDGSHEIGDVATDADRSRVAWDNLADLLRAEAVIAFTEEPRSAIGQLGGRHVEFGIALADGKAVRIVGPRENVFHFLPFVVQCETIDEAAASLEGTVPAQEADHE